MTISSSIDMDATVAIIAKTSAISMTTAAVI